MRVVQRFPRAQHQMRASRRCRQYQQVEVDGGPSEHHRQRAGVEGNDEWIMARRDFAAPRQQKPRCWRGRWAIDQPLGGDEAENKMCGHSSVRSITIPAQVKPGPNAVIITRFGKPRAINARAQNSTVGALILPLVAKHMRSDREFRREGRARSRSRRSPWSRRGGSRSGRCRRV